ncbi:hypothetical protein FACS1894218_4440 [Bacilli bacterium]|nr:hypothetical protein FACS1894218_4440 [Bacilli bacterium]
MTKSLITVRISSDTPLSINTSSKYDKISLFDGAALVVVDPYERVVELKTCDPCIEIF